MIHDRNEYEPIKISFPTTFPEFKEYLTGICIESVPVRPQFVNQSHRLVVVIEKATSKDRLTSICERYGADLLIFSGQLSVTRVNDIVQCARKEGKPIALFYICDLDCAGWYMPEAFFNRINDLYPRDDHIMRRVALTREQAVAMHLPAAFDLKEKGYSQSLKENFCTLSGGDTCIELDALSEPDLISFLEKDLSEFAGLEADERLSYKIEQESANLCESIESDLSDILEDYQGQYEILYAEYTGLINDLTQIKTRYQDRIEKLNTRRSDLQDRILQQLENAMEATGLTVRENEVWM